MALSKKQLESFQWIVDQVSAELEAREQEFNYLQLYTTLEKLSKIDYKLNNYNVIACNYGLTERQEKRYSTLSQQALELMSAYQLHNAHIGGDPRGGAVRFELPLTKRFNTWGGDVQFFI